MDTSAPQDNQWFRRILAQSFRIVSRSLIWLAILMIRTYRYTLSPLLPPGCRFNPSCSVYAIEAIQEFGLGRGVLLGLKRISRCHPFTTGGDDPVTTQSESQRWFRS